MNNEPRNDIEDTRTESAGSNEQAGSRDVGNERTDSSILDSTLESGGTQDSESKTQGAYSHQPSSVEWGFSEIWNNALEQGTQRPLEVRDYLYASELYSAPIDTYLKMRAEPFTNPPNPRSMRKFEAGHLMEWIVGMLLKRAGILKGEEIRAEYQYDGLLRVSGRMDKLAGGTPNLEQALEELRSLELPEGFMRGAERIVVKLLEKYPNGLGEKPIEIKSVSSFAMDSMEKKNVSIKRHRVQLYHYLKSTGYTHGLLVYICRDDMRMAEFPVLLDSPVEQEYKGQIELLTKIHGESTPPEKEPLLIWEEDFGKFSKNLNVEYSVYLTKLYGFETPRDYSEVWGKKPASWNAVLKRIATGAKMTPKNLEYIEEMKSNGYDPEALAKLVPLDAPEEEEVV